MSTERDEEAVRALGQLLREGDPDGATRWREPGQAAPGWQRLGERRLLQGFRDPPPAPRRHAWAWAAPALALCAALGVVAVTAWPFGGEGSALSFAVRSSGASATPSAGMRVEATTSPSTIEFSDGSSFTLHPGAKALVARVDAQGAALILERGRMEAKVTPAPRASWSVDAGPYRVQVTGTAFTTLWEPQSERFSVLLDEGSVRLVGGSIQGSVELRAGQRFDTQNDGAWSVTALGGARSTAAQPRAKQERREELNRDGNDELAPAEPDTRSVEDLSLESAPALTPSARREARHGTPPARTMSRPRDERVTWTTLVSQGKFEQVVSESHERGHEQCLSTCSTDELGALADAARYTGRIALAREALLRLRTRAPERAARAGFFLGSLSEAQGESAPALDWYTRCLQEAPAGPLAAEARAGRMRTLLALGRRQEARSQAEEYLRLHPRGVAAERARQLSTRP